MTAHDREEAVKRLDEAAAIIEAGDQRLLASDRPAGGLLLELIR